MLFAFKEIEAIVWPVARVTKKRKSMNEDTKSDDYSEDEDVICG